MHLKILPRFIAVLLLLSTLYAHSAAFAADTPKAPMKPVQVFDVTAGKVIKSTDNNPEFQAFAKSWLAAVTGLSPKLQPEDKCGYVYRIPLDEPAPVKTGSLSLQIENVFLFYCPGKEPLLLVFDHNRRPFLFHFKGDLKPFLAKIGIPQS